MAPIPSNAPPGWLTPLRWSAAFAPAMPPMILPSMSISLIGLMNRATDGPFGSAGRLDCVAARARLGLADRPDGSVPHLLTAGRRGRDRRQDPAAGNRARD